MMIRYLLDTNIVSYYLRRTSPLLEDRISEALGQHSAAISVLTRAELRFGQEGMEAQDRRQGLIDNFLLRLPSLAWADPAADQYGKVKAQLKRQGTPIGELDTQIAAHALAESLILVTHNTKHFERVEGLKMEDWLG